MAKTKQPTPASREQLALQETESFFQEYEIKAQVSLQRNKFELGAAKQFVRREGWVKVIQTYMRRRVNDGVNRPLKYLTLPGQNASDIGLFWKRGLLQQTQEGRLNVAICDRDYADEVTLNLTRLGGPLTSTTRPLHDDLNDLNNSKLRPHFPFDVINLDICGCLIPAKKETEMRTLQLIFRLQRRQSFLLLLTTRPESNPLSSTKLPGFIRNNIRRESKFRTAYVERFGSDEVNPSLSDVTAFSQMVIPKMVARMSSKYGYRTREYFAARYTRPKDDRPNETYEMVCHSFEFEPLGRQNPALKYEPDVKAVPASDIAEIFEIDLSTQVENQARLAYRNFIVSLPNREARNVTNLLGADRAMTERLDKEAKSLEGWWTRFKQKANR
jgi:hypothetical protein